MSNPIPIEDFVKHNVEVVLQVLDASNVENDYGMGALTWLENYADQRRPHLSEQAIDSLVATIGSYLGECLCRTYNGVWIDHNGAWGVSIDSNALVAFPFNKVHKFLVDGPTDSFVSMFRTTAGMLEYIKQKNANNDSDS